MTGTSSRASLPASAALTDLGNAERLVAQHGKDLRFAPGLGWLAWDGRRWKRDTDGEPMRRAKHSARSIYADIALADEGEERKRVFAWAQRSQSESSLRKAVKLAETERPVIVDPNDLDAHPYLLNVANGTVDLRTGVLREHRREDLLTKITSVVYDPDATSELWDSFLATVTGGDAELAGFYQRAVGYSLTGHTNEEVLFFAHGPTATGKSSLLEAGKGVFGEYATTADFETFLKHRGDAGIRNDVARLAGARLVISIEVDDGKALAEGLLKLLTGGDTVAARFLYRETFEFQPSFKLWLAANDRPKVRADDGAMWRRILQLPFTHVIPESDRDDRIKVELRTNPAVESAILAWAVHGCLEWQRIGLAVPAIVLDYTAEYRAENDPLREWLTDCCDLAASAWTASANLRRSYEAWCETNGEKPIGPKAFGHALATKGHTAEKSGGVRGWRGISLA